MLLVDADQPEAVDGREHRRACPDDDACLAARDALALVAALGVGQPRVEDRDAVAEPCGEATGRLRRQRDLRHEHDRAEPTFEGSRARAEVDLGLPAARRPREQEVRRRSERADDAGDRSVLLGRQSLGRAFGRQRLARHRRRLLLPPLPNTRGDERERPGRRRPVVLREPEREVDEGGRQLLDDAGDRRDLDPFRSAPVHLDDDTALPPAAERHVDDGALPDPLRNRVREDPGERPRRDEWVDGGEPLDRPSVELQHAARADVRWPLQCPGGLKTCSVRSALHVM